jgi:hypothetical protein
MRAPSDAQNQWLETVASGTGLNAQTLQAWVATENGWGINNPLGINSGAHYQNLMTNANDTIAFINNNYPQFAQQSTPQAQAQAIVASGWQTGSPPSYTTDKGYAEPPPILQLANGASGASSDLASSVASFLGLSPSTPLTKAQAQSAAAKYATHNAGSYGPAYQAAFNDIYTGLLAWIGTPAGQVPFNVSSSGGNTSEVVVPSPAEQATGNTQRGSLLNLPSIGDAIDFLGIILIGVVFILIAGIITLRKEQ